MPNPSGFQDNTVAAVDNTATAPTAPEAVLVDAAVSPDPVPAETVAQDPTAQDAAAATPPADASPEPQPEPQPELPAPPVAASHDDRDFFVRMRELLDQAIAKIDHQGD